MRLYTFVNALYMKEIQWGIQTHHVAQEIVNKYVFLDPNRDQIVQYNVLKDWSLYHKTDIILNGGILKDLKDLFAFLQTNVVSDFDGRVMPFSCFHEDEDSLGGIMTAVGIILTEQVYDCVNYKTFISTGDDLDKIYPADQYCDDWFWFNKNDSTWSCYTCGTSTAQFLSRMKRCGLAR